MIEITTPIQHAFLKKLLDGKTYDGIAYTFAGEQGKMKLLFEAEGEGNPVEAARKAIKSTETGAVLYFQIRSCA